MGRQNAREQENDRKWHAEEYHRLEKCRKEICANRTFLTLLSVSLGSLPLPTLLLQICCQRGGWCGFASCSIKMWDKDVSAVFLVLFTIDVLTIFFLREKG
jgi:hypothetical protein